MANRSPRTSAQNTRIPTDLEGRTAQLASLTLMLYGRGREAFNDLFEHDRDNILWLVNDLAAEVRDMVDGGAK